MEQNNNTRRVISLLVDNSNGVLARISSLFCRRGFNIDSLTVSATNDPAVSRITVTLRGSEQALTQLILQTDRLEVTRQVFELDPDKSLQRELLLLITLKRQSAHTPLRSLFDKHRVWQNRRALITEAVNRLSHEQLRQAVQLLMRAELTLKQDYGQSVWAELESLSLLLCHKALADVFIDG